MAIKIDRMDSRKCSSETATKAYMEVRAEVSILHSLVHPNVIEFIGVVLQPLCFILEWAPGGSLSSIFQKYRKQDARIGPLTLQRVTQQVRSVCMAACGIVQSKFSSHANAHSVFIWDEHSDCHCRHLACGWLVLIRNAHLHLYA